MKKISLHGFGLFSDVTGRKEFAVGEIIFHAGEYADKMYLVIDGVLRLTQGENEIDVLTTGDLFGEMGMVENRPRNGTVTAVTECTLIPIDRLRFAALVRQHPGFAQHLDHFDIASLRRLPKDVDVFLPADPLLLFAEGSFVPERSVAPEVLSSCFRQHFAPTLMAFGLQFQHRLLVFV